MPFCNTCRLQALWYLAAITNLSLIPQPRNYPSNTTTNPEVTNNAEGRGAYTILTKTPSNARYKKSTCKADANDASTKNDAFRAPTKTALQGYNRKFVSMTKSQPLGCALAPFATDVSTLLYNLFSIAWCFIIAKSVIFAKSVATSANVLPILNVYRTEIAEFCARTRKQRWS